MYTFAKTALALFLFIVNSGANRLNFATKNEKTNQQDLFNRTSMDYTMILKTEMRKFLKECGADISGEENNNNNNNFTYNNYDRNYNNRNGNGNTAVREYGYNNYNTHKGYSNNEDRYNSNYNQRGYGDNDSNNNQNGYGYYNNNNNDEDRNQQRGYSNPNSNSYYPNSNNNRNNRNYDDSRNGGSYGSYGDTTSSYWNRERGSYGDYRKNFGFDQRFGENHDDNYRDRMGYRRDQYETMDTRREYRKRRSDNNAECIIQCAFGYLNILDENRSPSESAFIKWLQDNVPNDGKRIRALRETRRCFARLATSDTEDGCEFSKSLSNCLNLDIET